MAKKAKKSIRRPNISPLTVLRPRLDALFAQPEYTQLESGDQEAAHLEAELTALLTDLDPEQYLPILVKAVNDAAEPVQSKVGEVIPDWLHAHDLVEQFRLVVQRDLFQGQAYQTIVAWLTAAGTAPDALQIDRDPAFYRAYYGADDMGSQGFLMFFWYTNRRQDHVRGINILVDFNPPWDGAAKDITFFPQRAPQDAIREFVDIWEERAMGIDLVELDPVTAKQRCFAIFERNRMNEIRLHKDFIAAREQFVRHLFALPDGPDTIQMTIEEFDELCQSGQVAELIQGFEQSVGRLVRTADGTNVLVGADSFLDEDSLLEQLESR